MAMPFKQIAEPTREQRALKQWACRPSAIWRRISKKKWVSAFLQSNQDFEKMLYNYANINRIFQNL